MFSLVAEDLKRLERRCVPPKRDQPQPVRVPENHTTLKTFVSRT
jgi:hypothetical protein